jgi:hypothetical protein
LQSEIEFSCLGAPTPASKALQVSSGAWSKFRAINLEIIVDNCSKLNESARGDHEVIQCKGFIGGMAYTKISCGQVCHGQNGFGQCRI